MKYTFQLTIETDPNLAAMVPGYRRLFTSQQEFVRHLVGEILSLQDHGVYGFTIDVKPMQSVPYQLN